MDKKNQVSLRKTNIAWILSFVEPGFSINMWNCVSIFDMKLEMKQSKETIGKWEKREGRRGEGGEIRWRARSTCMEITYETQDCIQLI